MNSQQNARAGLTLIEVVTAAAIFTVLMVTATLGVHQDSRALRSLARKTSLEVKAEVMLARIESQLQYAQGATAQAWLQAPLTAGESNTILVDTTFGFPDQGTLLFDPGTASEERISYESFGAAPAAFTNLTREERCTDSAGHASGALVRWAESAVLLEDQVNPPANFFDGISEERIGQAFFRGDGTGFSFRVPTDPTGNMDFFDAAGEVQWGATVGGTDLLTGWSCLVFEGIAVISEQARGVDLNRDGDQLDSFDLGRIKLRSWDATDPLVAATDLVLCPPMVLQEQCAFGSDLDNDGFEDPIFLWDPTSGRLRIRLFLLTSTEREVPEIRLVERAMFLRNGSQN